MAWISEGNIAMKYLLPTAVLNNDLAADFSELSIETQEEHDTELVDWRSQGTRATKVSSSH